MRPSPVPESSVQTPSFLLTLRRDAGVADVFQRGYQVAMDLSRNTCELLYSPARLING